MHLPPREEGSLHGEKNIDHDHIIFTSHTTSHPKSQQPVECNNKTI
jgi:hypothetical protein